MGWEMAVGSYEVVRPLPVLVFSAIGCPTTLLTSENTSGGVGLVADKPTHARVALVHMVNR